MKSSRSATTFCPYEPSSAKLIDAFIYLDGPGLYLGVCKLPFWKFSILQNSTLPPWNTRQYKVTRKALNFVLVSGCHWHVWHKPRNSPLCLCFPAQSFVWLFRASFSGLSLSCIWSTPYQEYIKTHTYLKFSVLQQGYNSYLPQLLTNTTKPSCWDR